MPGYPAGTSANRRYLEFISAIQDDSIGHKKLERITETKTWNYKRFNFFSKTDKQILITLSRGEFNIYGFRSKDLAKHLCHYSKGQ